MITDTSTLVANDVGTRCPKCELWYEDPPAYPSRCYGCNQRFGVFKFDPPEKPLDTPEVAMPDDVTCAFHPGKRAVEACGGTGSYICALCAVPIGDKTYSADFINSGGLKELNKGDVFGRTLPRPDNVATACAVLALISGCTLVGPLIFLVVSVVYYVRHIKLKQENALYSRVTSSLTTWVLPILYVLAALAMVGFAIAVLSDF